jgi:hypothetical protein
MEIKNKYEAIAALNCLIADFEMLRDGQWMPDEASCQASVEVTQAVLDWIKEN